MYWKESITKEVQSTRCLKLATPTVELLAWLWRTRWARRHDQPLVKIWREILLKRKMRPHYRGEAWQLENKRRKRRKPYSALHVIVYEEPIEEGSSGDESDTRGRVKVIKHIELMPVPDMEEKEAAEIEKEAPTPLIVAPTGKSYKVENDSFIIVEEENEAKLFQRRGSFSIPQGAPDDNREHELEPAKEEDATGPVVTPPWAQQATATSKVKAGAAPRHERLEPDTVWISTKEKLFQRRGSFSLHPEDAIEFTVGQAPEEGKDQQPPVEYLVEHDAEISSGKVFDARRGSFSVLPADAMEFTGVQVSTEGKAQQPRVQYTVEHDIKSSSSKGFDQRRGSFCMHPGDTIEFNSVQAAKEGKVEKSRVRYIVEGDVKGCFGKGFDARRGSFSVRPEDVIEFTGGQASEEGEDQQRRAGYIVEHNAMSSSDKGLDARRGSFMLVEEAGSSTSTSDQTLQSSEHPTSDQPLKSLPYHISNPNEDGKSHVTHRWLFD